LSVATLLFYHYPLFKYIVENIEGGFNGILIFITMIVVMLAANYMVYYLLIYLCRRVGRWLFTTK
jgi:lipid A ethanolaminephosphotransferase